MQKTSQQPLGIPTETWGGIALLCAAIAALMVVNLGGASWYHQYLETHLTLGFGSFSLDKSAHHWINDGLMALFFLVIGIEIKREFLIGNLNTTARAIRPVVVALGGFIVPALVYAFWVSPDKALLNGWSIPTATDIAFVVALMAVLKNYIPKNLQVFLLALAVVDDLLAILVIAFFYTETIVWLYLFLAALVALGLYLKTYFGYRLLPIYLLAGFLIWLCILKSGVHATIAGVIFGLLLPISKSEKVSLATKIEHFLQPWVRWLILPVFAFANVGVDLHGITFSTLFTPLTIAIILALVFGKQVGVLGTLWLLDKFAIITRPIGTNWLQIWGASALCGIGFTMSLFITSLALGEEFHSQARLGILIASLVSALTAIFIFTQFSTDKRKDV